MATRDDLANVIHDSGCGCSEGPDEYTYAEADAILTSGVIDRVKADALREAAEALQVERDTLRAAIQETRTALAIGGFPLSHYDHILSRAIDTKEKP